MSGHNNIPQKGGGTVGGLLGQKFRSERKKRKKKKTQEEKKKERKQEGTQYRKLQTSADT